MQTRFLALGLVMAIAGLAGRADAGRLPGPGQDSTTVPAHTTKFYYSFFESGKPAVITVTGDGDTDLDLYVYDENGHLIVRDVRFGDRCTATFTPRWTGLFRIEVRNLGSVYNRYELRTN